MATYYHTNGGGNGGGNDWGSWIPIIVLFCIPTPVTWIIADLAGQQAAGRRKAGEKLAGRCKAPSL